ncbi:chromosomal replication initiator protein DnaA [Candidatus Auribacterota bacterium]
MNDLADIWGYVLKELQQIFSKQIFETWFLPLRPLKMEKDVLTLEVPNTFFIDWIKKHYLSFMENTLKESPSPLEKISLIVTDEKKTASISSSPNPQLLKKTSLKGSKDQALDPSLNPKYSFANFVVGSSNRFAYAACVAVAQAPAKSYNPLFIYGGVCLGKTHLMHSIGQEILSKNKKAKVLYISSEKFTNQLIDAIQKRTTLKFKNHYRNVDVILLDDIQFLSGKEQTQEEFFHTFNTLYDGHKQIVLSSDRQPKEIPNLEERLVSRFEWGLVSDLQPPDTETRIAILKKKAELSNLTVPDEITFFLAERIKTNIRKLEGALIRVVSYASSILLSTISYTK